VRVIGSWWSVVVVVGVGWGKVLSQTQSKERKKGNINCEWKMQLNRSHTLKRFICGHSAKSEDNSSKVVEEEGATTVTRPSSRL
jgi:hypothetical protein